MGHENLREFLLGGESSYDSGVFYWNVVHYNNNDFSDMWQVYDAYKSDDNNTGIFEDDSPLLSINLAIERSLNGDSSVFELTTILM